MTDITYAQWMDLTAKRFARRSTELKRVDAAFKAWEEATTGGIKSHALQDLARCFKDWVTLKGQDSYLDSIRNRKKDTDGFGPVERLQSLIRTHKSSNVGVRRDLQGTVPDRLILDASLQNLRDSTKVRETYNRAAMAVNEAHKSLLQARNPGSNGRQLYERWFGTFDANRYKSVIANMKNLCDLFAHGVIIIHDARQLTNGWQDTFGFAMPGKKQNYVEFTVGNAFFMKSAYTKTPGQTPAQRGQAVQLALAKAYKETSDWTVGTMVHELSHAINNLPDVDFQPPSTYQVSQGGLTSQGWEQCSTPDLDLALALADPDLAILNVDNYGQCAREALMASGK